MTCTSSPVADDVELVERLDRRLGLALGGAEGGEIVLAYQALRGSVHGGDIKRARHPPGTAGIERQIGPAVDDAIEVMTLHRRRPGVEVVRNAFGCKDGNGMRAQMRIERVAHGIRVPILGEIDMRHLAARVHAGIGASGALHQRALAGKGCHRGGKHALHSRLRGLDLPAGKRRAVVFDGQLVARHD